MSSYTIPYVVQHTPRGERTMDLYSRLLADRIVYLGTELDDGVANTVIAQLLHLASEGPETPISLYINSPGGSITAMLAVYDAMQYVSAPVATTCVGQAAWTAAVLLAGGEPGQRAILPHGRVVLHQPAAQGRGTVPDLILEAEEMPACGRCWRRSSRVTPGARPSRCGRTPTATWCSRGRRPSTTGSSTWCWRPA